MNIPYSKRKILNPNEAKKNKRNTTYFFYALICFTFIISGSFIFYILNTNDNEDFNNEFTLKKESFSNLSLKNSSINGVTSNNRRYTIYSALSIQKKQDDALQYLTNITMQTDNPKAIFKLKAKNGLFNANENILTLDNKVEVNMLSNDLQNLRNIDITMKKAIFTGQNNQIQGYDKVNLKSQGLNAWSEELIINQNNQSFALKGNVKMIFQTTKLNRKATD